MQRLTDEDLRHARNHLLRLRPDADDVLVTYYQGLKSIEHFLGHDWTIHHVAVDKPNPYFEAGPREGVAGGFIRQHRVMTLAARLFQLQDVPGFAAMTRGLRSRSLPGAAAELTAVSMLREAKHSVRFIEPSGVKGQDYDAEAVVRGTAVAVEVKAKDDAPVDTFTERGIDSTLKEARKQLPRHGPGVVFLQIPPDWANSIVVSTAVDATIARSWRNTARVNAVVVLSERRHPQMNGGMAFEQNYRILGNPDPRAPIRNILRLVALDPRPVVL